MIQGVFQDIDDINTLLTMTFGWTIYWYCTINIVTNARRMRRYIKLTSFSIKDAVVYHFCDFILSLFFLNILYILLSFFIDVSYTDHLFYPLLLYVITMPIFCQNRDIVYKCYRFCKCTSVCSDHTFTFPKNP